MPIRSVFENFKGLRSSSAQVSFVVSRNNKQERKCLQMCSIVLIKGLVSDQIPKGLPAATTLRASSSLYVLGNHVIGQDGHLLKTSRASEAFYP
ncbi:hypothetical protein AVEN_153029-1 [Araneus ventricosus]|uniref:Uncharacterized protein n=1 Tax=Araneus ventricosus TaxID=182803 RepID=A0A4Y2N997_ARAVE|nr:hypothetical protein AVEN_153029-1 [Araneus ventricosus]